MQRALLIVPHFWDPICVPLGVCALKSHAEQFAHKIDLFDFNTVPRVFRAQHKYFEEGKRQFPYWKKWNMERNGTDMLAFHQLVYLYGRQSPNYRDMVAEIVNMNDRPVNEFMDTLDIKPFNEIFEKLFNNVSEILANLLEKSDPDVVGCYLNNSTWPATLFILEQVKKMRPDIRTVVGGPGPIMGITSSGEEVRTFFDRHDFIDYFVVGEGEHSFLNILDNPDLPSGILDPDAGRSLVDIKKSATRMDEFPLPDYGSLETNRYVMLSVSSSRGCPFECSFCAETVFWKGFRTNKSTSKIYEDIDQLAHKYNRKSFYICDSLSNHIMTPLTNDIKANGKPYTMDCYLRADHICTDESRTQKWKEGGLFRARLGLESASQRILDEMVKKTNPENMAKSLYSLAKHGIATSTLWISCYPGETLQEFQDTLKFIRTNKDNIYEADVWLFQYHPKGLSKSSKMEDEKGSQYRFSKELNDIFAISPYVMANDMTAKERFERLEEFISAIADCGIPNPYSVSDIIFANKRWNAMGRDTGWDPMESMQMAKVS